MRWTPNITMKKIKRCKRGDAIATRVRISMMFVQLARLSHKLRESHGKVFLSLSKQGWPKW